MTSGKRTFEQKGRHNFSQLHRWLRHWSGGVPLQGSNRSNNYSFDLSDIDHVIGISVIGGNDVWCRFEPEQTKYSRKFKLSIAITITDAVFSCLARKCVGARDFLPLVSVLMSFKGERVAEKYIIDLIEASSDDLASEARSKFSGMWNSIDDLNNSWKITRDLIHFSKSRNLLNLTSRIMSDLTMGDAIWWSVAERSLSRTIALPGQFGALSAIAIRSTEYYKITCVVCAHMSEQVKILPKLNLVHKGLYAFSTLELGPTNPLRMTCLNDYDGDSVFHKELTAISLLAV
jgi:hypothetical protein